MKTAGFTHTNASLFTRIEGLAMETLLCNYVIKGHSFVKTF